MAWYRKTLKADWSTPNEVKAQFSTASVLRIFYGPGYRVYFVERSAVVVILLLGGDKSSQQADISKAKEIAKQLEV